MIELIVLITVSCLSLGSSQLRGQHFSNSICHTPQYRSLTLELQNEHQCMVLEKLQTNMDADKTSREALLTDLIGRIDDLRKRIMKKEKKTRPLKLRQKKEYTSSLSDVPLVRDCSELSLNGITRSGVYPIKLQDDRILNLYCDLETANGGWTVIQRRMDGSTNFTRTWNLYSGGFGNANGEYWLGNEIIHQLTYTSNYTLRIDMWDWDGRDAYSQWTTFRVAPETDFYRLSVSGFEGGTAGDSLTYQSGMQFSTYDRDNDHWFAHCAQKDLSGWWYRDCGYSALNGLYVDGGPIPISADGIVRGIIWYHWNRRFAYSLKRVEMKIKPRVAIDADNERNSRTG
ncbi:Ryncolin-4,Angiopoietin-related protein 1,Ficolin-3,Ficolin-2,Ryncolin-1,Tenascin-R,Fibrinogen-likeprotein 1,Angiopoietin-1,Tenascin-X,Fibrinogen C domain-containing protein 1-A,Fibrinogen C domain-containing protein 1,Fibrinogen gamma chain,Angiopoietin-related protein 2,Angiopoietin-2,Microfibril-associated glycoprotein 4,Fibrinogen alpha chain,Ficolin-1-A,Ficolin-1,Fibrinogen C domain-containing protein 1-B,Angiopoietin-4 [Mytilus coruscus]|uniref:Fibrinogen C-terminal domain-containing protein n=1 Tax=Mytilus coruscus TaxID=42192 RepID=A0A6J8B4I8_MYTCO|nr:Ryncolin-4,Angiopoietin-related protein 1,Ficolin-3,Ficolin-2,Ryncolin-1,Tenascin-R,Fibrinogen-likeprotein 1,Angiopoietin-1,Tenascin-X,Fibrinogen C domain-containing protein 1-A,Fibrinogen C domain-containing protein 1,Fibrinogen gamma chain,Angiopoietin-related protein 2,Angiopoietin-2,Microfibril-associated glycoprotein 4,Fibrinogen alpha chain,Ficolin-1-A,Ficolin-1,Fibrinogen C domain-containing protein 1-B,Angiopoietin-4 [Mytilus coruscus]